MKNTYKLLVLLFGTILWVSCEKEYYSTTDNSIVIDPSVPISYSAVIKPIFTSSCLGSGCHDNGGNPPTLTADKSYDQITMLGYVDADTPDTIPENSLLYKRIIGTSKPMPPDGKLSQGKIDAIALWIKQGSKNN
jgi:hypothetical protein